MNLVTALAVVIGLMGGVATWLYVGPLAGLGLSIWATFIAWGAFYHGGGGEGGLKSTIIGAIWGALMATVALVLMPILDMGALGAGIAVGLTVVIMILAAQVPLLSAIPPAVYGYASTAAFALLKSGADATAVDITNGPFLNIVVSMIIGAVLGFVSEKIAGSLAKA